MLTFMTKTGLTRIGHSYVHAPIRVNTLYCYFQQCTVVSITFLAIHLLIPLWKSRVPYLELRKYGNLPLFPTGTQAVQCYLFSTATCIQIPTLSKATPLVHRAPFSHACAWSVRHSTADGSDHCIMQTCAFKRKVS